MPGYKAIGQVGLGGFLYVTAAKLISKLSQYGESGAPVPERPARYTPAVLSTLSSYSSPETLLPIPNIAQNVTATITMSSLSSTDASTISPLWTMILSLWSLIQVMVQFLTEQCGEFIAELTVQLLLLVTIALLGNHIDQVLRRILGHPESPNADECVNQEAPANSTTMRITKATIHLLHELADRIQHRINKLEAMIANIIVEGTQAINNLCAELHHAKKTITSLERKLREMIDDRDRQLEEANTKFESATQKVHNLEAELEEISTKHNNAVEDSQTKLEEAEKGRNKVESELSEASDKIAALETNLECMVDDRDKAASDRHTEAEIARKRIAQLEVQCKHWRNKLDESEATITQKIDKAVTTAKNNAEKVKTRLLEVAKVGHDSDISKLKAELIAAKDPSASDLAALKADLAKKEEMEKKLIAEKDQSASEVAGLREALAEKEEREKALIAAKNQSASEVAALKETLAKKEDEESTPSFNPAAKEFTPHRGASSDSTLTSTPYTSLPATPLSPSPSPLPTIPYQHTSLPTTPFAPSPSPFPPAPYQQTPVKKQELRGEPRRVVDGINNKFAERSRRKMMGMPAEDEETKPLSKEELDRRIAQLSTIGMPSQQLNPQQPAFAPGPSQSGPIQPLPSPTFSAPELGQHPRTPDMTGQPPNHPTPPTGPKNPAQPKRHNFRGLKPGAPGTPPIQWPAPDPPLVEGAPTAPQAMRRNGGRPPGLDPRPNRGNFNGRGRGNGGSRTQERPQLPAFLRENAAKKEEARKEGGAE